MRTHKHYVMSSQVANTQTQREILFFLMPVCAVRAHSQVIHHHQSTDFKNLNFQINHVGYNCS